MQKVAAAVKMAVVTQAVAEAANKPLLEYLNCEKLTRPFCRAGFNFESQIAAIMTLDATDNPLMAGVGQADYTRESLQKKIAENSIIYASGDMRLFHGWRAESLDWVFSFHEFFLDPEALDLFAAVFWDRFEHLAPIQVGGMELSGIPLVLALVREAQNRGISATGFIIRRARKVHGLGRIIDTDLNDDPIIVVDDAFKTGMTMERSRVAIESVGKKLTYAFAIVDFEWSAGSDWLNRNDVKLEKMFTLEDFGLDDEHKSQRNIPDRRQKSAVRYEPVWKFSAPGAFPYYTTPKSAPVVEDGALYFGSDSGTMWCLDASTGSVRWAFETNTQNAKGIWSDPALKDGKIYFGATNGNMFCLDAEQGEVIWSEPISDSLESSPCVVAEENLLVIGTKYFRERQSGGLTSLDLDSGSKVWEHPLENFQRGRGTYVEQTGLVVSGTEDNSVLALSAVDGNMVWSAPTNGSTIEAPLIISDRDLVVVASDDRCLRILSLGTGEELLSVNTGNVCRTTPLCVGDRVYCGSADSHLYVLNLKAMELEAKIPTRGKIYSSLAKLGDGVLFGNSAGVVEEICSETLQTRGAFVISDAIANRIVVCPDSDLIFVPTVSNEIYCMRRSS